MKTTKPRNLSRIWLYLFFMISVAGLLQSSTAVSSSRSLAGGGADSSLRTISSEIFQAGSRQKIAPDVFADTAGSKSTSVVVMLAEQADVSSGYNIADQDARGWFVYNTLTQHAARTQVGLKKLLADRGVAYQSFWAANMIVVTADRSLIELMAARPDVAMIDSNRPARWIEDPDIAKPHAAPNNPEAAEWGVLNVNAPSVWALGFTGVGMVIGDLDTGQRWTHSALKPRYRGWNGLSGNHNFNWWDAIHSGGGTCGANTIAPCDDQGHGTHTAGTTVGDDGAGNQVGVAPGAKWIGCRNMDQGNGTPATYTECFQFTIAPTDLAGLNANPSLRPHVINNSWGCPVSEGCTTRAELETITNNVQAAGIFVVVSAGNSGPGCSSVSDPPAIYNASFTVGAYDISNTLASFSSRGPSTFYTPNVLKPNISAPGVTVRSSTRTSDASFGSLSGTSMAGPHVAGVVALLWSARPLLLRNIAATKLLLQNTANPAVTVSPQTCGGTPSTQIPNNTFGYGRVDALAAYNAAPTAAPARIGGQIVTPSGQPVAGATVTVQGGSSTIRAITNKDGFYKVEGLEPGGFYTVTPARANFTFAPENRGFSLVADRTDAVFTGTPTPSEPANPLESPEFFVRQQYLDFLVREPEQAGLDFWAGQLRACGADEQCLSQRRIDVSAAFFIAREFQDSGLYLYELYKGGLGRRPDYAEYAADRKQIVGGPALEGEKAAFASNFVERAEFQSLYPLTLSGDAYVSALLVRAGQTAGIDLGTQHSQLLALYDSGATTTESRSLVLRALVEGNQFRATQYNGGFVLAEYFSYLDRNPDRDGYNFWVNVLNGGSGNNYRGMVCAFLTSTEYQHRFSSIVTRSNSECE
jgi:serine protease AprX